MTIKEIIQKLYTTITDSRGQESHFESWLTLNDGIIDAIDALKALDKQEPIGYVSEGEPDRLIAQKQTKTPLRNYRLFTHDVPLYTTPHTKVGCVECRVSGGHAFYCVACAKNLFGGYKK